MSAPTRETLRFAPSATGRAHPGTLLAALLCWLDARARGARVVLRIEDLDPERVREEWVHGLESDLGWLGLDFDEAMRQSTRAEQHARALDRLAERGLLYACACSRSTLHRGGVRAPDGSFRYPGTCRGRGLPGSGWRSCEEPIRAMLPAGVVDPRDAGGFARAGDPSELFGDPVVRRRDGACAYHLASVVDDAEAGVTRIVRGRDLADSTLVQIGLQRLLGLSQPSYRHHLLLLERAGGKLAKLHGAVAVPELHRVYTAERMCGLLAAIVGLRPPGAECTPRSLVDDFDWRHVRANDCALAWEQGELRVLDVGDLPTPTDG